VTITPVTSLVEGAATITLKQFQSLTLVSDGTNWITLRSKPVITSADLPNPSSSTLGGVQSIAAVSHQFLTSISTSGVPTQAQPAFSDISGSVAASQLPAPTASTLGGIESLAAVTHKWVNAISTSGVPSATQPASTDLSDVSTLATLTGSQVLTGKTLNGASNGNTVTLLNAQNNLSPVVGTAADTNIFSWSIPANIVAVGKSVTIKFWGSHSTGTGSVAYKLKIGSTLISSYGSSAATSFFGGGITFYNQGSGLCAKADDAFMMFTASATLGGPAYSAGLTADFSAGFTVNLQFNAAATEQVTPLFWQATLNQ
jgi:hypothetical protein